MRIERMIKVIVTVFALLFFIVDTNAESQRVMEVLKEAKELKNRHKYDEAISAYRRIVDSYSGSDEADHAQVEIGNIYAERGMFEEAIREYQRVVDQYSPQIRKSMASFQATPSKELQLIDTQKYPALKKMPMAHQANRGIICSYLEMNKHEKAMEVLQEEIKICHYSQDYAQFQIESLQQEIKKRKKEEPERKKIKALLRKFEQGYNAKDLELLKGCYTSKGYESRLQDMKRYFGAHKKVQISIIRSVIEFQGENQAIVEYFSILKEEPIDGTAIEKEAYCNRLLIKEDGEWKIK